MVIIISAFIRLLFAVDLCFRPCVSPFFSAACEPWMKPQVGVFQDVGVKCSGDDDVGLNSQDHGKPNWE